MNSRRVTIALTDLESRYVIKAIGESIESASGSNQKQALYRAFFRLVEARKLAAVTRRVRSGVRSLKLKGDTA